MGLGIVMRHRTTAQSAQLQKTAMWVFGLLMAGFEIVVRHGEDEAVFIFLLACIGYKPMGHIDDLFHRKPDPELQTPAPEAVEETVK